MTLKGLLILTTVLLIGGADAFAMRLAGRSHREPTVRTGVTRTLRPSGLRGSQMDPAGRKKPTHPYSSRGHTMKGYRQSKSFRGGGRGTIKVLR